MLEQHFGCPVRFATPRDVLVFSAVDMDRPFATRNDDLSEVLGAQLEAELAAAGGGEDLAAQVKRGIKRSMAGKRPTLEDVARELRLSERSLQRRLTEAGLTFQQLIAAACRELARQYLRHTPAEFSEVAYLLGYPGSVPRVTIIKPLCTSQRSRSIRCAPAGQAPAITEHTSLADRQRRALRAHTRWGLPSRRSLVALFAAPSIRGGASSASGRMTRRPSVAS